MLVLRFLGRPRYPRVSGGPFGINALLLPLIRFVVDTGASRGRLFATAEYATKTTTCIPIPLAVFLWYGVAAVYLGFMLVHILSLIDSLDKAPG